MLKVTIYQDKAGEWRWRAMRGGRIVADGGEGYTRPADALRAWHRFFGACNAAEAVHIEMKPVRKPARRKGRK